MQVAGTSLTSVFQPFHSLRAETPPMGELLARPASGTPPQTFFEGLAVPDQVDVLAWQLKVQQALRDAGGWTVSLNVHNRIVESDQLRDRFLALAECAEGPVVFEFTETYPMPPVDTSNKLLRDLREMGHRSALDDFGTGLNGISLLLDYDFDIVKVDRSLLHEVEQRPHRQRALKWIHQTLDALEKDHVVEGIENEETFEVLTDLGFHHFQGYHFHEPAELHTFGVTDKGMRK